MAAGLIRRGGLAGVASVLAGAVLLLWPALLNGYPILFSDTGGFLEQALMPDPGWDKPWIYGPFLTPFDAGVSLWGGAAIQALILSAMLWMALDAVGWRRPLPHLVTLAVLAAASAAPWFASLLMPDVFAPVTVLGLFVLTGPAGRCGRAWVGVVTVVAIASHLAHLLLAAACLLALGLLRRRVPWRGGLTLGAALALLLATNFAWYGRPALSPYGQVFALARMVADGPAAATIRAACPAAKWHVCAFADRLPSDSDAFLWDPFGPVWGDGYGPIRLAPEAGVIVRRTIEDHPLALAEAAVRNTARQLLMVDVGDALSAIHLETAVVPRLQAYFPAAETARFRASRQAAGTLAAVGTALVPLQRVALLAGLAGTVLVALRWRRDATLAKFAVLVLVALAANAASTGALSKPNDRYQARIAWLLLLPPTWALIGQARAGRSRPHRASDENSAG